MVSLQPPTSLEGRVSVRRTPSLRLGRSGFQRNDRGLGATVEERACRAGTVNNESSANDSFRPKALEETNHLPSSGSTQYVGGPD